MGWEPETVLTSTISQLELAIKGKIDFVKKTNPFGSEEKEEDKILDEEPNPEAAMRQIVNMVKRRQSVNNRQKPKSKER